MPTAFALRPRNGRLVCAATNQDQGGEEPGTPQVPELTFEQDLRRWTITAAYEETAMVYDTTVTDVVKTSTITWPDGSTAPFNLSEYNGKPRRAISVREFLAGRPQDRCARRSACT